MDFESVNHLFHYLNAYLILFVVLAIIVCIYTDWLSPASAFFSAIIFLLISGVVELETFLTSFSNVQVITIFSLIFITSAIRMNTNVDGLFERWFKRRDSSGIFMLKLSTTVAFLSSFLNNTPIVSMFTNNVQLWARKKNYSPSKYLIPLSYAAILGGMITVIGTSTNLVLMGLLSTNGEVLLSHMDFLVVGSVVCVVGLIYIILFGTKTLPDRKIAIKYFAENIGEYVHEVDMKSNSEIIGKSVQQASMKNLQGIYLVEISRQDEIITPVSRDTIIQEEDRFYFAGETELVVEFVKNHHSLILPNEEKLQKVGQGNIFEVIVAVNSDMAGNLVKDSSFRQKYNASIIGIHRNGEKVTGKIGYVKLKAGDLLLCLTGSDFERRILADKNLYLLTEIRKGWKKPVVRGSWYYKLLQLLTIFGVIVGQISFFMGLLITLFLLVVFKYLNIDAIKKNFDFDLLIVLACSLTLGKAFIDSGAAEMLSHQFLNVVPRTSPRLVIASLFLLTVLLTSLITNIAAVSIAFPLAFALAHELGIEGAAFYLAIAFGASAAFLSPTGYQTNMMVYGPGGYKSFDFFKAGLPLLLLYSITSLFMIFWWYDV